MSTQIEAVVTAQEKLTQLMASDPALAAVVQGMADQATEIGRQDAERARRSSMSVKANPEKGGISLYGLGRMPVTLYGSQWDDLEARGLPALKEFRVKYGKYLPATKGASHVPVPASLIGEGKPFRHPKPKPVGK